MSYSSWIPRIKDFVIEGEGLIRHLYVDTTGNTTIGVGHNIEAHKDLLLLPYSKERLRTNSYYLTELKKYLVGQGKGNELPLNLSQYLNSILENIYGEETDPGNNKKLKLRTEFDTLIGNKVTQDIRHYQALFEEAVENASKEEGASVEKVRAEIVSFLKGLDDFTDNLKEKLSSMDGPIYNSWEIFLEHGMSKIQTELEEYEEDIADFSETFLETKPTPSEIQLEEAIIDGRGKGKLAKVYRAFATLFISEDYAHDVLFDIDVDLKLKELAPFLNHYKDNDNKQLPLDAIIACIDIAYRTGAGGFNNIKTRLSILQRSLGKELALNQLKAVGIDPTKKILLKQLVLAKLWEAAAATSDIESSQPIRNKDVSDLFLKLVLSTPRATKTKQRIARKLQGELRAKQYLPKLFPTFKRLPISVQHAMIEASIVKLYPDMGVEDSAKANWGVHKNFSAAIKCLNLFRALKQVPKDISKRELRDSETKKVYAHLTKVLQHSVALKRRVLHTIVTENYKDTLADLSNFSNKMKKILNELGVTEAEFKKFKKNPNLNMKSDKDTTSASVVQVIITMIANSHGNFGEFIKYNQGFHRAMRIGNWPKVAEHAENIVMVIPEKEAIQLTDKDFLKIKKASELMSLTRGDLESYLTIRKTLRFKILPQKMKSILAAMIYIEGHNEYAKMKPFLLLTQARKWEQAADFLTKNPQTGLEIYFDLLEKEARSIASQLKKEKEIPDKGGQYDIANIPSKLEIAIRQAYGKSIKQLVEYEKVLAKLKLDVDKLDTFFENSKFDYHLSFNKEALWKCIKEVVVSNEGFDEFVKKNNEFHTALKNGKWVKVQKIVEGKKIDKPALSEAILLAANYEKYKEFSTVFKNFSNFPESARTAIAVFVGRSSLGFLKNNRKIGKSSTLVKEINAQRWDTVYNYAKANKFYPQYQQAFNEAKKSRSTQSTQAESSESTQSTQAAGSESVQRTKAGDLNIGPFGNNQAIAQKLLKPENKNRVPEIHKQYAGTIKKLINYEKELAEFKLKPSALNTFLQRNQGYRVTFDDKLHPAYIENLMAILVISNSESLQEFTKNYKEVHFAMVFGAWERMVNFFPKKHEHKAVFQRVVTLISNHQKLTELEKIFPGFKRLNDKIRIALGAYALRGGKIHRLPEEEPEFVEAVNTGNWDQAYQAIKGTNFRKEYKEAFQKYARSQRNTTGRTSRGRSSQPLQTAQIETVIRKALKTPRYQKLALETMLSLQDDLRRRRRPKLPSTLPSQVKSVVEDVWAQMA